MPLNSQSNYIHFNVSLHGHHFFRTNETLRLDMPRLLAATLANKFPASEGYAITMVERVNEQVNHLVSNPG